jgi:hypothetical protein
MTNRIWCGIGCAAMATASMADVSGPPFDFSDEFYLANGIDAATLIGRPTGQPPNSIIDNRDNGPDFNNVRILQQVAAFDHSGHPIFFSVTGLPTLASFTNNPAGQEALAIAESFNVYEFPRATNPQFTVFPKRQDLIADLRNGYFSNDPLGIWRINLVRYTPAALGTPAGQAALADLAARNGVDLDGTPLVKTLDEIQGLSAAGFVTIETPPMAGGPGVFRWFFCPVIEDPRGGSIAPDAFLEVVRNPDGTVPAAEHENLQTFNCLQATGDFCRTFCLADANQDGHLNVADFGVFLNLFAAESPLADANLDSRLNVVDFGAFLNAFAAGCP